MEQMKVTPFRYSRSRDFFKAAIESKKISRPGMSLGSIARIIGLKSSSSLTMILNGDRHPSKQIAQNLMKFLGLRQDEEAYLSQLIARERFRPATDYTTSPKTNVELQSFQISTIQVPKILQLIRDLEREAANGRVLGAVVEVQLVVHSEVSETNASVAQDAGSDSQWNHDQPAKHL